MTRIISGFAGSIGLTVPPKGTRPTSDRVREAIFSSLDARGVLDGARVLDLYAGSGSLGLEAGSRGASSVTLVENGAAAASACRKNAALVQKNAPKNRPLAVEVAGLAVQPFLAGSAATWDVVFLDPPYELSGDELATNLAELVDRLSPDAILVVERSSRDPEPIWPNGLELEKRKNYGDTTLWWARPSLSEDDAQ